jgi:hypothetical protein
VNTNKSLMTIDLIFDAINGYGFVWPEFRISGLFKRSSR